MPDTIPVVPFTSIFILKDTSDLAQPKEPVEYTGPQELDDSQHSQSFPWFFYPGPQAEKRCRLRSRELGHDRSGRRWLQIFIDIELREYSRVGQPSTDTLDGSLIVGSESGDGPLSRSMAPPSYEEVFASLDSPLEANVGYEPTTEASSEREGRDSWNIVDGGDAMDIVELRVVEPIVFYTGAETDWTTAEY
ncbi:hypothetical protein BJ508DRAFT_310920 [Ascobolus immersus RN42]|uniref:Uncharacterized protein n=1 Tax=Ascobolus immersus RN42 TaxID=1160509 RepID=A0A3N4HSC4_ASCIM|nr:hypothetical protein BJ508DRAFT_310920 [Ascobolus immersus RN42]